MLQSCMTSRFCFSSSVDISWQTDNHQLQIGLPTVLQQALERWGLSDLCSFWEKPAGHLRALGLWLAFKPASTERGWLLLNFPTGCNLTIWATGFENIGQIRLTWKYMVTIGCSSLVALHRAPVRQVLTGTEILFLANTLKMLAVIFCAPLSSLHSCPFKHQSHSLVLDWEGV